MKCLGQFQRGVSNHENSIALETLLILLPTLGGTVRRMFRLGDRRVSALLGVGWFDVFEGV